jgi:arsenical pump membrane protein
MHALLYAIVGISIALMLVRPRGIAEVWWIGGGVLLLLVSRLISPQLAARAAGQGADVYFFLIGMMLLSELANEHGVFDWLSSHVVRGARGSASRLFMLVYATGTLVTIFMSNDATAVVLTPAILTAIRKAKVEPMPHLFVCALIANAASFVLPISNPANLVVFDDHLPPLGQWLASFALPSVLSIVATFVVMRFVFRSELRARFAGEVRAETLRREGAVVVGGIALMVATLLTASLLKHDLGLPACAASLVVAVLVSVVTRKLPTRAFREISWSTLLLVAGLFIMVDAAQSVGALEHTLRWLAAAERWPGATFIVGGAVAVANNLVNNMPLGLIAGSTLRAAHTQGIITNAVLIGVDLGPNLAVTGSLATILWLLALRKEKVNVGFWQFAKVGALAMPIALLAALGGALAIQLLLHYVR